MSIAFRRLIGFAFASADLLIEISESGEIAFAMGASEALSGAAETAFVGRAWRDFIDPRDRPVMAMFLQGLAEGQRAGPIVLRLAEAGRAASLTAFRAPHNGGAVSCALVRANGDFMLPAGVLQDRAAFEALACDLVLTANQNGKDLELSLIELDGLSMARAQSSPAARQTLEAQIAGAMRAQAYGGLAATGLEDDRFALVRARGESPDALADRLTALLQSATGHPITSTADAIPLEGLDNPHQMLRALRYALDSFSREGAAWETPASQLEALDQAMRQTLEAAGELGAAILRKDFRLAYQPVVNLIDASTHHFEALVRFGDAESPFPQIRMAEEMDLIEGLDLAILETAIEAMGARPELILAVNVSGRTIMSPSYVAAATQLIAGSPGVRGRLMLELTETAAIAEMDQASRHLDALRREGCEICLDDFGAGASSLAYLQNLKFDVLKIDGRYIRDLQYGGRDATFVMHLVSMCRDLGIKTVAEMVETSAAELAVRKAGVDMAQGWLYGMAADIPVSPTPKHLWNTAAS